MAYAYRTPSVTLFGPAPASEWGPPPGPHVALSADRLRRAVQLTSESDPALLGVMPCWRPPRLSWIAQGSCYATHTPDDQPTLTQT